MLRPILALVALAGAPSIVLDDEPLTSSGIGVRELHLEAAEHSRAEHFALLLAPVGLGPDAGLAAAAPQVVGVARLFSAQRRAGPAQELELEFFELDTRVHHVERTTLEGPKLVWRELRDGEGRTVLLQRGEDDEGLRMQQWTGAQAALRSEVGLDGLLFPLWLLSRERDGTWFEGWLPVFDPLAGAVEERRPSRARWSLPGGLVVRRCRWTRRDGTPAGEWWFLGQRLVGLRFQEGGFVASAISAEEHGRLQRWGRSEGPP